MSGIELRHRTDNVNMERMDKLQDLAIKFEKYLKKSFPEFSALSLSNLTMLTDLRDRIEKNRPMIGSQTVDDGFYDTASIVSDVKVESSVNKLVQSMESCRDCLIFRQRVIESNLKAYSKFYGLYEVCSGLRSLSSVLTAEHDHAAVRFQSQS